MARVIFYMNHGFFSRAIIFAPKQFGIFWDQAEQPDNPRINSPKWVFRDLANKRSRCPSAVLVHCQLTPNDVDLRSSIWPKPKNAYKPSKRNDKIKRMYSPLVMISDSQIPIEWIDKIKVFSIPVAISVQRTFQDTWQGNVNIENLGISGNLLSFWRTSKRFGNLFENRQILRQISLIQRTPWLRLSIVACPIGKIQFFSFPLSKMIYRGNKMMFFYLKIPSCEFGKW